ncbi:hypothetical protein LCGC14_2121750 [marine sediment metagenome]|uniref:Uncharacterized protein n=1 Tax=marine sediment metagenome TaxID=412755 RepID=A0A0F9H0D8_9ZZZZ
MNPKALSIYLLVKSGWEVYIPISLESNVVLKDADGRYFTALSLSGYMNDTKNPCGRIPINILERHIDYLLFSEPNSHRAWLIPVIDVCEFQVIRLGKRYEQYELGRLEQSKDIEDKSVLRARSAKIAQSLKDSLS